MKYLATFLAHGTILGQSEIEAHVQPHSMCYFCATCGEIWGRIFVRPEEGQSQYWEAEPVPCIKHRVTGVQDWGNIPGSFLIGAELHKGSLRVTAWARAIEHLPQDVLNREFEVHEAHFDRKLKDEQDDQAQ